MMPQSRMAMPCMSWLIPQRIWFLRVALITHATDHRSRGGQQKPTPKPRIYQPVQSRQTEQRCNDKDATTTMQTDNDATTTMQHGDEDTGYTSDNESTSDDSELLQRHKRPLFEEFVPMFDCPRPKRSFRTAGRAAISFALPIVPLTP